MKGLNGRRVVFIILLVAVVVCSWYTGAVQIRQKILPDELNYAYYSGLFKSLLNGHTENCFWRSNLAYYAVPAGVYWMALTIYFGRYNYMLREPESVWCAPPNFKVTPEYSSQQSKAYPFPDGEEMIHLLRSRMRVYTVATGVLVFLLAWYAGGLVPAAIAPALLLVDGEFLNTSTLAAIETIWLSQHFLNLLLICLFFWYVRKASARSPVSFLLSLGIGMTAGLLTATKIHGALNVVVYLVCCWLFWSVNNVPKEDRRRGLTAWCAHVALVLAAAAATFVLVNPVLYAHPFAGLQRIVQSRGDILAQQIQLFPQGYLASPFERLMYLKKTLRLQPADIVIFFVGLAGAVAEGWRRAVREKTVGVTAVAVVSFFCYFIAVLALMFFGQQRYLLVFLCYFYLFEGVGIWRSAAYAGAKVRHGQLH